MILEEHVALNGHVFQRWRVHPSIILGGFIFSPEDWQHLHNDFGIQSVINVCIEQSDEGKGISHLAQCPVPDNGEQFPLGLVRHAVAFAQIHHGRGPIYVHCALGNSRSPAFAYAILRWVFDMTIGEAIGLIRAGKPGAAQYGSHPVQQSYLRSVESTLTLLRSKNVPLSEQIG